MTNPSLGISSKGQGLKRLVFLHGLCGNKELWKSQIDFFSPEHEVIAIDLLGHGKSPNVAAADFISKSALVIFNYLQSFTPKPTIVIGHSLGGWVLNELLHLNNNFNGAVFVDSPCMYLEEKIKDYHDWKDQILKSSNPKQLIKDWFTDMITSNAEALVREKVVGNALNFSATWLADIMGHTQASLKGNWHGQIFIMEGIQYFSHSNKLSWRHFYPNARHWLYPNQGHFYFLEDPKPFNDELNNFTKSF
jgi:pimeloyl-ACP methyl ester carboxylesterase